MFSVEVVEVEAPLSRSRPKDSKQWTLPGVPVGGPLSSRSLWATLALVKSNSTLTRVLFLAVILNPS